LGDTFEAAKQSIDVFLHGADFSIYSRKFRRLYLAMPYQFLFD
jgi:hypothetical protein